MHLITKLQDRIENKITKLATQLLEIENNFSLISIIKI